MSKKSFQKEWSQMIAKAWMDPEFKQRLFREPHKVFSEMHIPIPSHIRIKIIENTPDQMYFVFPEKPSENLSEMELKKIAAAFSCIHTR